MVWRRTSFAVLLSCLALLLAGCGGSSAPAAQSRKLVSFAGDGFRIDLPTATPKRSVQDRSVSGKPYQLISYESETSDKELVTVAVAQFPLDLSSRMFAQDGSPLQPGPGVLTFLALLQGAAIGGGGTLVEHHPDQVDGNPSETGRMTIERDGYVATGFVTVTVRGPTMFEVTDIVDGRITKEPSIFRRMVDSVQLD